VQPRPVIGITTQTLAAVPDQLARCWGIGRRYVQVLASAGAVPMLVPLLPDDDQTLRAIYDQLDGVFLAGGVDVDPAQYGEARHGLCGSTDPDRDRTEVWLVRWALADGKPTLGVCRGLQLMNVAAGGSLYQDLGAQLPQSLSHDHYSPADEATSRTFLAHEVQIAPASHLRRILEADTVRVNSLHHQGIKDLAPGFEPTARAPDGSIEGIEACDRPFLIGVQWHPEELAATHPAMRRLFSAFIEAASAYRKARR
jgi:putative glutamine amidotransferase